jgi:predicted enzyme related to lactoylglutathione lyase
MEVFDRGKLAYIADPSGAAFALWQAGAHAGADEFNTPGFMSWNELATRDVEGAIAFYGALFGWTVSPQEIGEDMTYNVLMNGDRPNGAILDATQVMPDSIPSYWGVYFTVADCEASMAAITEHGGSVMKGPHDTPGGRMAACADPQGAVFMVIANTEAA